MAEDRPNHPARFTFDAANAPLLTTDQRDGVACVVCSSTTTVMRPVGSLDGGQLFACASHNYEQLRGAAIRAVSSEPEPTDNEPVNPDPNGMRPAFLHALVIMLHLTTRLDLPIVKWEVAPGLDWGADGRGQFPRLHGHIWQQPDRAAKVAALAAWVREFDAETSEVLHAGQIQARARFTFHDVPVEIVVVYEPEE